MYFYLIFLFFVFRILTVPKIADIKHTFTSVFVYIDSTKEIVPSGRHISKKVVKVLLTGSQKMSHPATKAGPASKHGSSVAGSNQHTFRNLVSSSSSVSSQTLSAGLSSSNSSLTPGQNRHHTLTPTTSKLSNPSRVLTSSSTKQLSSSINMPYR